MTGKPDETTDQASERLVRTGNAIIAKTRGKHGWLLAQLGEASQRAASLPHWATETLDAIHRAYPNGIPCS